MNTPLNAPEKDLRDLTFDELVTAMTWEAVQDITRGKPLRSIVYLICDLAIRWRGEQDKKNKEADK